MRKDPSISDYFWNNSENLREELRNRSSGCRSLQAAALGEAGNKAENSGTLPGLAGGGVLLSRPMLALVSLSLVWAGPILACGSFQPRPTPTPSPVVATSTPLSPAAVQAPATLVPTQPLPPTATALPSPTPTIAIQNPLSVGDQARIVADTGLNIREQPSTNAPVIILLARGKRVLVLEGPAASEGFIWWRVDDNQGNIGWIASGDGREEWISPQVGEPRPVNRSPIVGDRVVVTLAGELSVRALPGVSSPLVARARTNEQFNVVAGPQSADNYFWYQIRSDDGSVEGWAADGREGERWLTPLE